RKEGKSPWPSRRRTSSRRGCCTGNRVCADTCGHTSAGPRRGRPRRSPCCEHLLLLLLVYLPSLGDEDELAFLRKTVRMMSTTWRNERRPIACTHSEQRALRSQGRCGGHLSRNWSCPLPVASGQKTLR